MANSGAGGARGAAEDEAVSAGPSTSARRPALADVARAAGVSLRTASRALHAPDLVAPATRSRIEAASKSLGYVPDLLARSLVSKRSGVITALVPPIADPVFIETVRALSETVESHGYQLLVGHMGYREETEAELVAAFLGRRPDAMILTGVTHSRAAREMLGRANLPVCEIWNLAPDPIDMLVGFSNFEAARALTRRLWRAGRRRIALVTRPVAYSDRARDRRAGYAAGLRELGAPDEPGFVMEVAGDLRDGAQAARALWSAERRPDAILLTGENLAAGAALELLAGGVRLPEEVTLAGFGDLRAVADGRLGMVSVLIDGARIGRQAGELLMARLRGLPAPARAVDVGFEIA
jgi:LacI family gluconate utilization system Gnt-I transcriptional repressor